MENPKNTSALVFYEMKIYADQITAELRDRWKLTKDEAILCLRELRNSIRIPQSYEQQRYESYTNDFTHKRLSFGELIQHFAVLALYVSALKSNKLKQGSLTQDWNPANGWHTALNRMFMVAHAPKYTVTGPDLCTLLTKLNKPEDLLLHQMFKFHCDSLTMPQNESFSLMSNALPNSKALLGRRNGNEIVFLHTMANSERTFSVSLTPNFNTVIPRRFQGTYRLGIEWNTDANAPLENFAVEDIIAKCTPFGPMKLELPLLNALAKRTA